MGSDPKGIKNSASGSPRPTLPKEEHRKENSTPQGQQYRLYSMRVTQKGEKSCLRVTKTDSTEAEHSNRNKPRGHRQRLHKMRAPKKESRMKPEVESSKNEGQKA